MCDVGVSDNILYVFPNSIIYNLLENLWFPSNLLKVEVNILIRTLSFRPAELWLRAFSNPTLSVDYSMVLRKSGIY